LRNPLQAAKLLQYITDFIPLALSKSTPHQLLDLFAKLPALCRLGLKRYLLVSHESSSFTDQLRNLVVKASLWLVTARIFFVGSLCSIHHALLEMINLRVDVSSR
jgi:hypothetical protein